MNDDNEKSQTMVANLGEDGGKADGNSPLNDTKETFVSDDEDLETCPCGGETDGLLVECGTCSQWYHLECVGLKGLTEKMVEVLENWECPRCFTPNFDCHKSSPPYDNEDTVNAESSSVRNIVKQEIKTVMEELKNVV